MSSSNDIALGSVPPKGVLRLPPHCSIAIVTELRDNLLKGVGEAGALSFDAAGVERIDTAGLQLLVACAREQREASRPVVWLRVSNAFMERARLLDLEATLGLPADAVTAP
jgi:ABC-type transporter Mla MlaB component